MSPERDVFEGKVNLFGKIGLVSPLLSRIGSPTEYNLRSRHGSSDKGNV